MINNRFHQPRIAAERVEEIDQVCNGFFGWTNFAHFCEAVEGLAGSNFFRIARR